MLWVLVPYRQLDGAEVATAVVDILQADGYEVFRDADIHTGLHLGDDLVRALHDRIDRADVVIAVVSPELETSRWCFAELMTARALGKRVIPIVTRPGAKHDLIEPSILAGGIDPASLDRLRRELAAWTPGTRRRWDWKRGPFPGLRGFAEDEPPCSSAATTSYASSATVSRLRTRRTG